MCVCDLAFLWHWFARSNPARVSTLRSHSITNHENILMTAISSGSLCFGIFCFCLHCSGKNTAQNWIESYQERYLKVIPKRRFKGLFSKYLFRSRGHVSQSLLCRSICRKIQNYGANIVEMSYIYRNLIVTALLDILLTDLWFIIW